MNLLPPPGPARTRQLGLLGVLTIVLVGWFWYQHKPATATVPAATSKREGTGSASSEKDKLSLPDPVKLADLEPAPEASPAGRNPFRFGQKPLPPPPPPPPAPAYVAPVVQPPPQPQGPPLINLKLWAFEVVLPTKQRLASLQDPESGATFLVAEGDIIDGRYRVVKFNADSVIVSYLDGSGRRTIFLEK